MNGPDDTLETIAKGLLDEIRRSLDGTGFDPVIVTHPGFAPIISVLDRRVRTAEYSPSAIGVGFDAEGVRVHAGDGSVQLLPYADPGFLDALIELILAKVARCLKPAS